MDLRFLTLCLVLLITSAVRADDVPMTARPGDYVRIDRQRADSVQGELVRVQGGSIDLRLELALERARRAPARPFGPSISTSF